MCTPDRLSTVTCNLNISNINVMTQLQLITAFNMQVKHCNSILSGVQKMQLNGGRRMAEWQSGTLLQLTIQYVHIFTLPAI